MKKRILLFGGSGFIGKYLSEFLKKKYSVYIVDRNISSDYNLDVVKYEEVEKIIKKINPRYIINLIGNPYEVDILKSIEDNVLPTINIIQSVIKLKIQPKILVVGTAAEYGIQRSKIISEKIEPRPITSYGLSKFLQTSYCRSMHSLHDVNISIARPFNIIGQGMSPKLVPMSFITQVEHQKNNNKNKYILECGNVNTIRDFIDIDDLVSAFSFILLSGKADRIYNICSGNGVRIHQLISMIMKIYKIKDYQLITTSGLKKNNDISRSVGNNSSIRKLGWIPKISLEESLRKIIGRKKTYF